MSIYRDVFEGEWAVQTERAGEVVQLRDEQLTWYAAGADFDAACRWASGQPSAGHESYTAFCERCPGFVAGDKEALPLMARFAAGKYDMTTEDGREDALVEVFRDKEDDLAFACMLLDMEAETNAD